MAHAPIIEQILTAVRHGVDEARARCPEAEVRRMVADAPPVRSFRAALESAPQSLPVQQAVVTSYERKLDFLRQAAAITAEG